MSPVTQLATSRPAPPRCISDGRGHTSAFTLIEMIISITIFVVFIGIVGGSYATLVKANRSANETQKIYRQVRHVFDALASAVREGALDYGCIDPSSSLRDARCIEDTGRSTKKTLGVVFEGGLRRKIFSFKNGTMLLAEERRQAVDKAWTIERDFQSLAGVNVNIERASFAIFPEKNPYDGANAGDNSLQYQPSVTISMHVTGTPFRTTYASRSYGKRTLYERNLP